MKIKIKKLNFASEDEDGSIFEFSARETKDFMLITKKKGTLCGEHFHEGKVSQKNPEILILIEGEAEIYARDLENNEELRETVKAPSKIEIYPGIYHEVKALTDIIFLEFNSLGQHKKDTVMMKNQNQQPQ